MVNPDTVCDLFHTARTIFSFCVTTCLKFFLSENNSFFAHAQLHNDIFAINIETGCYVITTE
jgi:hypothetical protein